MSVDYSLRINLFTLGSFNAKMSVTNNIVTALYDLTQPTVNILGPTIIPLPPPYDYAADNVYQNGKFTEVAGMNFTSPLLQARLERPNPYFNIYYNGDVGVDKNVLWSAGDIYVDGKLPIITIRLFVEPVAPLRRSLYSDNSLVFYRAHSLSTGSGGSGVRNMRAKQRRT